MRLLIAWAAAATMTLGNLAALWQDDVRRLLGWSSVSQSGYALMAVAVAGSPAALAALLVFLAGYAAANLTAFGTVTHLRGRTALGDYAGLFRARPFVSAALILAFLSLVGIPPVAGFVGKFALFAAALEAELGWLVLLAVANSVLSLFYYLRVAGPMVFETAEARPETLGHPSLFATAAATAAILVVTAATAVLKPDVASAILPQATAADH